MEWLLGIVACLGLWGTMQNKTKVEQVVEYHTTVVIPADDLIKDCKVTEVPGEALYNSSSWTQKEDLLFTALNAAQKSIILCNTQLASARAWKVEQLKIYADPPPKK